MNWFARVRSLIIVCRALCCSAQPPVSVQLLRNDPIRKPEGRRQDLFQIHAPALFSGRHSPLHLPRSDRGMQMYPFLISSMTPSRGNEHGGMLPTHLRRAVFFLPRSIQRRL